MDQGRLNLPLWLRRISQYPSPCFSNFPEFHHEQVCPLLLLPLSPLLVPTLMKPMLRSSPPSSKPTAPVLKWLLKPLPWHKPAAKSLLVRVW